MKVEVEQQHRIFFGFGEAYIQDRIQTPVQVGAFAVEGYMRYRGHEPLDHTLFQRLDIIRMGVHIAISDFQRPGDTDNAVDIFSSAPHVSFLRTAMEKRLNLFVFPQIHESDSFWAVELVGSRSHSM